MWLMSFICPKNGSVMFYNDKWFRTILTNGNQSESGQASCDILRLCTVTVVKWWWENLFSQDSRVRLYNVHLTHQCSCFTATVYFRKAKLTRECFCSFRLGSVYSRLWGQAFGVCILFSSQCWHSPFLRLHKLQENPSLINTSIHPGVINQLCSKKSIFTPPFSLSSFLLFHPLLISAVCDTYTGASGDEWPRPCGEGVKYYMVRWHMQGHTHTSSDNVELIQ